MDDQQRIALVRVGAAHPDDRGPAMAFHLGDHLGSSNAVVDFTGTLINREEFTPYGETSFGSFARKRYRFTGKERDEESGLNYHEARYALVWLGRWASCDPTGAAGGINQYQYAAANPMAFRDPGGTQPTHPPNSDSAKATGIDDGSPNQCVAETPSSPFSVSKFSETIYKAKAGEHVAWGTPLNAWSYSPSNAIYGSVLGEGDLAGAQPYDYEDGAGRRAGWLTTDWRGVRAWTHSGQILGAAAKPSWMSMSPGLGASMLDPSNLLAGRLARGLVGSAERLAVRDAADAALTAPRGRIKGASNERVNEWIVRDLPNGGGCSCHGVRPIWRAS